MDLTTKVFSILPQVKEISFIKELFQIIGHYSDDFLKNRTKSYLLKIAKTQWEIKAHLEQSISTERKVYFKLFAVKFANPDKDRKVLGILFALNFLSQHEQFKKSHLFNWKWS